MNNLLLLCLTIGVLFGLVEARKRHHHSKEKGTGLDWKWYEPWKSMGETGMRYYKRHPWGWNWNWASGNKKRHHKRRHGHKRRRGSSSSSSGSKSSSSSRSSSSSCESDSGSSSCEWRKKLRHNKSIKKMLQKQKGKFSNDAMNMAIGMETSTKKATD